jgi:hypothetical protein
MHKKVLRQGEAQVTSRNVRGSFLVAKEFVIANKVHRSFALLRMTMCIDVAY